MNPPSTTTNNAVPGIICGTQVNNIPPIISIIADAPRSIANCLAPLIEPLLLNVAILYANDTPIMNTVNPAVNAARPSQSIAFDIADPKNNTNPEARTSIAKSLAPSIAVSNGFPNPPNPGIFLPNFVALNS